MPTQESGPVLIVVAAVVVREGRVLMTRRKTGAHLAGLWEFPGGKVEPPEDPPEALVREMREELGVDAVAGMPFAFNYHVYPGKRVLLLTYLMEFSGSPQTLGCAELGWFTRAEVELLDTPPADLPILEKLGPLLRQ